MNTHHRSHSPYPGTILSYPYTHTHIRKHTHAHTHTSTHPHTHTRRTHTHLTQLHTKAHAEIQMETELEAAHDTCLPFYCHFCNVQKLSRVRPNSIGKLAFTTSLPIEIERTFGRNCQNRCSGNVNDSEPII